MCWARRRAADELPHLGASRGARRAPACAPTRALPAPDAALTGLRCASAAGGTPLLLACGMRGVRHTSRLPPLRSPRARTCAPPSVLGALRREPPPPRDVRRPWCVCARDAARRTFAGMCWARRRDQRLARARPGAGGPPPPPPPVAAAAGVVVTNDGPVGSAARARAQRPRAPRHCGGFAVA